MEILTSNSMKHMLRVAPTPLSARHHFSSTHSSQCSPKDFGRKLHVRSRLTSKDIKASSTDLSVEIEQENDEVKKKAEEYSSTMQQAMGDSALIYRHELGMNYAFVLSDLIVGSCLQTPDDAERLKDEANVGTVMCLQQDSDLAYFGLELSPITEKIKEMTGIQHVRQEIRDFDPVSLRLNLPMAVAKVHSAMRRGQSPVYIHCTAGLGRAPAVALAYMHWLRGFQLDEANEVLQKVRRCSPKLDAIRAATCDLISGFSTEKALITYKHRGTAKKVEVAGLDIGWHNKVSLSHDVKGGRWILEKELPVGTYLFKFIVDDNWTYSPDSCLTKPDEAGNINNYINVLDNSTSSWTLRKRLVEERGYLLNEEREMVIKKLDELADALEASN